jgi:TP901 family phage tail tape measure protein
MSSVAFDVLARDRASKVFNKVGDAADRSGRQMTGLAKNAKTSSMSITKMFAILGGGVLLKKAIGGILSIGTSYQDSMNTFQSVSEATAAEMRKVGATAKRLGNDMTLPGTSAAQAGEAMTELAKAGLSVKQSMGAAKGTIMLAKAAMVDEAMAAEITANALNSFGLRASEANRVADLLAASANASSAEITDMADGLKQASAVFSAAGVPIEDLTTALGLMANAGIKGSDAGTSMKAMLLKLQGPSGKTAALMDKIGFSMYEADGSMKPLRRTMADLGKSLEGMSDKQRDAALAQIFGSDATRAANVLLAAGAGGWDKMAAAVTKAGAAQQVAGAKTKGLRGAVDAAKSVVETFAIVLFERYGPALENAARWAGEELPGALAKLERGLDIVGRVVSSVTSFFRKHHVIIESVGASLLVLFAAYRTYVIVTKAAAVAQAALNFVMTANPIGLVIVAVAALVAGLVIAYKRSETFRNIVNGAFKAVSKVVLLAISTMLSAIGGLFDTLALLPGPAGKPFRSMGNAVDSAREKVDALRRELAGLPPKKTVEVKARVTGQAAVNQLLNSLAGLKNTAAVNIRVGGIGALLPPTGPIPKKAAGGLARGWTVTGERGPGLVNFSRPARVYTAKDSQAMLGGGVDYGQMAAALRRALSGSPMQLSIGGRRFIAYIDEQLGRA